MNHVVFNVTAVWDDDDNQWMVSTDIMGFEATAPTLDELERIVLDEAPKWVVSREINDTSAQATRDLPVPLIIFTRPDSDAE